MVSFIQEAYCDSHEIIKKQLHINVRGTLKLLGSNILISS